jgi:hypothetical protein
MLQLRMDFKISIGDDKMVSHILYNVKPRMYHTTLAIIKRELNDASTTIDLKGVKKDLRQVYIQYQGHENHREKTVLFAVQGAKKFPKRFKGDCRICGRKGHKAGECWENDRKKEKSPPGFKPTFASDRSFSAQLKLKCTYWQR